MKPWIGVTTYIKTQGDEKRYGSLPLQVTEAYFEQAVKQAGGIPLLLPQVNSKEAAGELTERLDGLVVIGGSDVAPNLYGETPHKKLGAVEPQRDQSDLLYIETFMEKKLPVLGVCRGMQLLNVLQGGSLYQDLSQIESWAIQHDQATAVTLPTHDVTLQKVSVLYELFAEETLSVNTVHHQALRTLGKDLKVTAMSPDGIIEAIESTTAPHILGVQWHPELLLQAKPSHRLIFDWLVQQAKVTQ